MMKYPSGEEVKIGDLIWWDEGTEIGRVALLITAEEDQLMYGQDERGIFIETDPLARRLYPVVFYPESMFEDEAIDVLTESEWQDWRRKLSESGD